MGFSFVSVIELVYFMSLRPYFNHLRFSEKRNKVMRHLYHRFRTNLRLKKKLPDPVKVKEIKNDRILYPYLE